MAKAPVAGRVKTRLCPPCSLEEAAAIAAAALADTLCAVTACSADRRILALDGAPGPWVPGGFDVVPQCSGSFGARLDHAWSAVKGACVQIGMDTPQLTAAHLDGALDALEHAPAAIGFASDGGWWALALRQPQPGAFDGVAMSTERTGQDQASRLRSLGLDIAALPTLTDIDTIADLRAVIREAPGTLTARQAERLGLVEGAGR
jgi:rSAM/selenodomain-associated transferase 1